MLSAKDNELMCRTGPDTPMGSAMRHFWTPALLSSELPKPDGDPVHVELLGQSLVAFRDSNGKVGLLDEWCCHRGASLTVGRVEQCGIRCIYHGWLFAADGTVLETPNIQDPKFKKRVKAKSYPVREAGGLIWTYLGAESQIPDFPNFPFIGRPEREILPTVQIIGCNYVTVLEGLLDSSHLSILHISQLTKASLPDIKFVQNTGHMQFYAAPRIESEDTPFGFHYGAVRPLNGNAETNITAFVSPFFILNPNDIYMAIVPMTDEKCAFYSVWWDGERAYGEEPLHSQQLTAVGLDLDHLEAHGMTRSSFYTHNRPQRGNGWRQDRAAMAAGHFTGIHSFVQEDAVVCVSTGGIRDRRSEHLSTADMAIANMYRVLLKSARSVETGGKPVGYGVPVGDLRGRRVSLPLDADWRSLVPQHQQCKENVA